MTVDPKNRFKEVPRPVQALARSARARILETNKKILDLHLLISDQERSREEHEDLVKHVEDLRATVVEDQELVSHALEWLDSTVED